MLIKVYTDGACSQNGKTGARASWAYYFPNSEFKIHSSAGRVPDEEKQTNNRGELMAIANAVDCVIFNFNVSDIDLQIYTDSMYSKNCLTTWLPGWIRSGWITAGKREPVINRDLIEETADNLSKFKSYIINYVPAHTDGTDEHSVNNAIVDKMATEIIVKPPPVLAIPVLTTNTVDAIEGLPLKLMGAAVSEKILVAWCKDNLSKLDQTAVKNAMIQVLTKTVAKNGFKLEKVRLHRTTEYQLVSAAGLITESKDNGESAE